MKTVRFSQLVKSAGRPVSHTLWSSPEDDREFQQAVKKARVLTVHQGNVGQKADFGTVGFHADPLSQFLIFPRSLKKFEGLRVVGIKYDAFETPAAPRAAQSEGRTKSSDRSARNHKAGTSPAASRKSPGKAPNARPASEVRPLAAIETFPAPPKPAGAAVAPVKKKKGAGTEAGKSANAATRKEGVDTSAKAGGSPRLDRSAVRRELGRAMKELEAGKAVIAFRRLEKLSDALK
jgi:hypothetical protein